MTVKECYAGFGGNYDEILSRLTNDEKIKKFLTMFLKDPNFALLKDSMESGDYQTAFRAAHTLKGVCAQLSITGLYESSSKITEALRGGEASPEAAELLKAVSADYEKAFNAIKGLVG